MQITVQMLDGSITPFKVRSSITIASLKAKFEPWQPMKGRALLHHDVQLDDRAILGSIPGVKNGTVLRVDKRVSQVKNRSTRKKTIMSGPESLAVDEDVIESIETSGDDEKTSSENERRIAGSKRKRPSRTSTAAMEDLIDDDNSANSLRPKTTFPREMNDDSLNLTDTSLSNSTMALRITKKGKGGTAAHEHASASDAQELGRGVLSPRDMVARVSENSIKSSTANAHIPETTEAASFHQDLMDDVDATFLSDINAAAAETGELPLPSNASSEEGALAHRCNACGRACGCGGNLPTQSNSLVPLDSGDREQEAASANGNISGHLISKRSPASLRPESSWTGM